MGDSIEGIISELTRLEENPDYHSLTGPQRLARALIKNAFLGLRGSRREESWQWFTSANEEPCSFVWCCYTLGAEPSYLRKFILPY